MNRRFTYIVQIIYKFSLFVQINEMFVITQMVRFQAQKNCNSLFLFYGRCLAILQSLNQFLGHIDILLDIQMLLLYLAKLFLSTNIFLTKILQLHVVIILLRGGDIHLLVTLAHIRVYQKLNKNL